MEDIRAASDAPLLADVGDVMAGSELAGVWCELAAEASDKGRA